MKKLIITAAIILGLGMTSFADGGGLFQRGANPEEQNGVFGNRTDPATPPKTLTKCPWAPASPSWQPLAAPTSWPRNAERNNPFYCT